MLILSGCLICIGFFMICLSLKLFWLKYLILIVKVKIKELFDWLRISIRWYWGFVIMLVDVGKGFFKVVLKLCLKFK